MEVRDSDTVPVIHRAGKGAADLSRLQYGEWPSEEPGHGFDSRADGQNNHRIRLPVPATSDPRKCRLTNNSEATKW